MKKVKAFLLATVMCATAMLTYAVPSEAKEKSASNDVGLESEVLISFDNPRAVLRSVKLSGINKAQINEDSQYVTEGQRCLHLCPEKKEIAVGSFYSDTMIVLYPDKDVYNDAEYVSIDIYNPTDKSRKISFGYGTVSEEYTLEPGANTLWLFIDRSRLDYASKGIVSEFFVRFQGGNWEMGTIELYVDNFRCYFAKTEFEKYYNNFEQDLWYNFEKEAEIENLNYFGTIQSEFSKPKYSINRDIRYIQNGSGSLKVDFSNSITGAQDVRAFRTMDNQLGDLNDYLGKDTEYCIRCPIYNPNDYEIGMSIYIFSNYNDESTTVSTNIPANSWSDDEFVINLKDLDEQFSGTGLDIMTLVFAFGGMPEGGTIYLDSIGVYPVE